MEHNYSWETKRLILRPLGLEDIEKLRVLRNENRFFFLNSTLISIEQQKIWYESYLMKMNDIMFAVLWKGTFIGTVALYDIDWEKGICEYGRTLIDKSITKEPGIGAEAVAAVCALGFEVLRFNKIIAHAWETNTRIAKVHQRVGFVVGEKQDNGVLYLELTPELLNRELLNLSK